MKGNKRLKIFLASLILNIFFWWGINSLEKNLGDFWFLQEIAKNPQIFAAQINQQILEKKVKKAELEKSQAERLKDLKIEAKAAVLIEIDSQGNEKILFEKNSQQLLPIASLSKLMTALVIFDLDETYSLSQLITITKEAVEQEGSSKYGDLIAGESLSVENLLYIMLIESSNDAAFALAEPIGKKGFVGLMNIYAEKLGLKNTYFVNPTGLDPEDSRNFPNLSTVEDLVKLTKYILKNYPQIFEITTNRSYEVLMPNGSTHHFISENTNKLLGESANWRNKIIGGKTGWSLSAGGCLLLVTENPKNNSYFINIILGAKDRFNEMRKIINALNEN